MFFFYCLTNIYLHKFILIVFYIFMWTAEQLGLPLIPAHSEASSSGEQMRFGVNYASAASGILDDTGRNFVSSLILHT